MTDVRLTATNPDDSSVVPVACNAKGEFKLEEPPAFDGNVDGDLTVSGSGTFQESLDVQGGKVYKLGNAGVGFGGNTIFGVTTAGDIGAGVNLGTSSTPFGAAQFAGDVVVGSRGSKWMIVESGGIAHLIQQTAKTGDNRLDSYPELRNLPRELDLVEQALTEVMEKLRMVPPAGWEVWDGSSENS